MIIPYNLETFSYSTMVTMHNSMSKYTGKMVVKRRLAGLLRRFSEKPHIPKTIKQSKEGSLNNWHKEPMTWKSLRKNCFRDSHQRFKRAAELVKKPTNLYPSFHFSKSL